MYKRQDVSFEYPDDHNKVLHHVSLDIKAGERLALVGPSGGGKTTLCNLIPRFYDVTSGHIYIDGQDIQQVTLKSLREDIGIVQQDVYLFSGSVADNIAYGKPDATREEIIEAARLAGAERFIMALKDGFDTYVGERGVKLSGGQKQRVAIARALATRPKYLLCDEATSALDPNTTQSILRLLKQINQTLGVTIVVITHEMRVIEQICQRVAVIDQSCIAEIGNVSDVFTHPKSDIAKALILPKSPAENLPPCTGRRLRLVFDGSCSNEPVISRITLECNVPVNILFADTRIVEGSIYGHMVIDLPDDPQQFHDVLRWLDHNHISYLQEDGSHV